MLKITDEVLGRAFSNGLVNELLPDEHGGDADSEETKLIVDLLHRIESQEAFRDVAAQSTLFIMLGANQHKKDPSRVVQTVGSALAAAFMLGLKTAQAQMEADKLAELGKL